jgi:hypothetical protein
MVFRPSRLYFDHPVSGPPQLKFEPLKFLNFDFNADPDPDTDPAFHSNTDPDPDPDPASKNNSDPCGSGSTTLAICK